MTENKRFQEYYQGDTIVSIHDKENDNELLNILQCVDLLNEQHEEIQRLQKEMERVINDTNLTLGFIHWKGYSMQDIAEYEEYKKEVKEVSEIEQLKQENQN